MIPFEKLVQTSDYNWKHCLNLCLSVLGSVNCYNKGSDIKLLICPSLRDYIYIYIDIGYLPQASGILMYTLLLNFTALSYSDTTNVSNLHWTKNNGEQMNYWHGIASASPNWSLYSRVNHDLCHNWGNFHGVQI